MAKVESLPKIEYTLEAANERLRQDMLAPLTRFSTPYMLAVGLCLVVAGIAAFAWGIQLTYGIGMAGIRRPVFWGFYIINFVFWIGISHAGTLISAILRLTDAGWRKPVTRAAEAITVFALMMSEASVAGPSPDPYAVSGPRRFDGFLTLTGFGQPLRGTSGLSWDAETMMFQGSNGLVESISLVFEFLEGLVDVHRVRLGSILVGSTPTLATSNNQTTLLPRRRSKSSRRPGLASVLIGGVGAGKASDPRQGE